MNQRSLVSIVGLVLLTILATVAVEAAASPDTMKFRPPDSLVFTSKSIAVRVRYADSILGPVDSSFLNAEYHLTKTATGYSLLRIPSLTDYRRDTMKIDNLISRLTSGIRVTLELSPSGLAQSITGNEVLLARLDSIKDTGEARVLRQRFTPQALSEQDMGEWNGRMQNLANMPVRLGVMRKDTASLEIGQGNRIRLYVVTSMMDTTRINGRLCARVRVAMDTDPTVLSQAVKIPLAELGKLLQIPDSLLVASKADAPAYHSVSDVTTETATLLMRSESLHRQVEATIPGKDGKPVRTRSVESVQKDYLYPTK